MSLQSRREPAFLRRKDVQIRTGLARGTIYLYIQQGAFPKPVTLGPRAVGWLESEVSAWITERVRIARDQRARCVERLGWHWAVYTMPFETIGDAGELVVFQNAYAIEPAFATAGTALASLHNDGLLILDELSQCDPKEAGEAAYSLAKGQCKARAHRNGTARASLRWRLLLLSPGEESLA